MGLTRLSPIPLRPSNNPNRAQQQPNNTNKPPCQTIFRANSTKSRHEQISHPSIKNHNKRVHKAQKRAQLRANYHNKITTRSSIINIKRDTVIKHRPDKTIPTDYDTVKIT